MDVSCLCGPFLSVCSSFVVMLCIFTFLFFPRILYLFFITCCQFLITFDHFIILLPFCIIVLFYLLLLLAAVSACFVSRGHFSSVCFGCVCFQVHVSVILHHFDCFASFCGNYTSVPVCVLYVILLPFLLSMWTYCIHFWLFFTFLLSLHMSIFDHFACHFLVVLLHVFILLWPFKKIFLGFFLFVVALYT